MTRPVTAEALTDEQIREVESTAVDSLYLDCLDATSAWPLEPRDNERWGARVSAARARIAAAINAQARTDGKPYNGCAALVAQGAGEG